MRVECRIAVGGRGLQSRQQGMQSRQPGAVWQVPGGGFPAELLMQRLADRAGLDPDRRGLLAHRARRMTVSRVDEDDDLVRDHLGL
jgi:hypothetical protein